MREGLTVTVITLNERRDLPRCLASVGWADEVVVVDAGSDDGTPEIAASFGARVVRRGWPGFVEQKNFALDQASHPWVLSLDADEWVTPALADEIRAVLERPGADGYEVSRESAFCGAFLRGGWTPDLQLRLFRRERGRFAGGHVHESVRMNAGSRIGRLTARLPHLAYRSLSDYVQRLDRYTTLAARTLHENGRRFSWSRLLLSPPGIFFKILVLKRGYRDGVRGLLVAGGSAFYVLLKYGKLWELSRRVEKRVAEAEAVDGAAADAPAERPRQASQ